MLETVGNIIHAITRNFMVYNNAWTRDVYKLVMDMSVLLGLTCHGKQWRIQASLLTTKSRSFKWLSSDYSNTRNSCGDKNMILYHRLQHYLELNHALISSILVITSLSHWPISRVTWQALYFLGYPKKYHTCQVTLDISGSPIESQWRWVTWQLWNMVHNYLWFGLVWCKWTGWFYWGL